MIAHGSLSPLSERDVAGLEVLAAGAVDLRRDLHLFVDFVQYEELRRAVRGNGIPKGPAVKLARILSWKEEAALVEEEGKGYWSDKVSRIAMALGLVQFATEGVYRGYSSTEPSYPDNDIEVQEKRFAAWLASEPLQKERAILDSLLETRENEFFEPATLVDGERFDRHGCAVGPASRMPLKSIRKALLKRLADLPAGVWYPMAGLVDLIRTETPTLILDPKLRETVNRWDPPREGRTRQPTRQIEDLYENFREGTVRGGWDRQQLSERSPDVFRRVEGRYLQFFLAEIPYLCGFVDLAFPPARRPKPDDPVPALDWLHAFRLTPRLRQVMKGDPELSRVNVTVLANFDVLVEAPSYPDRELQDLAPFCRAVKEDGPTHLLHLDRKAVVALVASQQRTAPVQKVLERLSRRPLPPNVASEIEAWCGHAEKLTVYEDVALVELRGPEGLQQQVRAELGKLVVDDRARGVLVARDPARTIGVLEQRERVPIVFTHAPSRFAACDGPLGAAAAALEAEPAHAAAPAPRRVRLEARDLVGYRAEDADFLKALHGALERAGVACQLVPDGSQLLVPASDLGRVRTALRRLEDRFDVELGR